MLLRKLFRKRGKTGLHKNRTSRSGFSLPRAFRTWSQIYHSLFGLLAFFVFLYILEVQSSAISANKLLSLSPHEGIRYCHFVLKQSFGLVLGFLVSKPPRINQLGLFVLLRSKKIKLPTQGAEKWICMGKWAVLNWGQFILGDSWTDFDRSWSTERGCFRSVWLTWF